MSKSILAIVRHGQWSCFSIDMRCAQKHAIRMSKTIQLCNVPDVLHRILRARAAIAGRSLSDYLLEEIKEIAALPTLAELRDRLHRRKAVAVEFDTARLVREEREPRSAT